MGEETGMDSSMVQCFGTAVDDAECEESSEFLVYLWCKLSAESAESADTVSGHVPLKLAMVDIINCTMLSHNTVLMADWDRPNTRIVCNLHRAGNVVPLVHGTEVFVLWRAMWGR